MVWNSFGELSESLWRGLGRVGREYRRPKTDRSSVFAGLEFVQHVAVADHDFSFAARRVSRPAAHACAEGAPSILWAHSRPCARAHVHLARARNHNLRLERELKIFGKIRGGVLKVHWRAHSNVCGIHKYNYVNELHRALNALARGSLRACCPDAGISVHADTASESL